MNTSDIKDPTFLNAVQAIDSGNLPELIRLIEAFPELVIKRLDHPEKGYFKNPYLIWFVADNPIRHEKLPPNIPQIAEFLVRKVRQLAPDTFDHQIGYALGLTVTGRIPRESGMQIAMMDVFIDAGARVGEVMGAIANGNLEAARHLVHRGGQLNLAAAICLDMEQDVGRLIQNASRDDLSLALIAASFFGKAEAIFMLLANGADANYIPPDMGGFHSHATALHQAVYSGSLESVKALVAAHADLNAPDRIFDGTALGWAMHMQTESGDPRSNARYKEIEDYLKTLLDQQDRARSN